MFEIPFKPVTFLLLSSLALLSACNTMMAASDAGSGYADQAVVDGEMAGDAGKSTDDVQAKTTPAKPQQPAAVQHPPVEFDEDSLFNLLAAEFAGNSGDIETSLEYYSKASQEIEDGRIASRAAYIALYGEDYDEALAALDRWRELEPQANDLPRMYAVTYLHLKQPDKAVPYIQQMLSRANSDDVNEALAVKQLLAKDASIEDGYAVLQQLNTGKERNKHLLILQSRYAAQLKNYDESLALLDEVLKIDPTLHEVMIIKSRILSAQGKHEEAAQIIKQLIEELPDNTTLRLQYARMLVEQNKLNEAITQYSVLYETLPDDEDIILSYALLNIETNNLDEAVSALEHLVEIDKEVATAKYYLGRIAQNQGENKQAVAYYLGVNDGEYAYDAQLRIGVLLAVLGKPDEGLAKLEALAEAQKEWGLRVKAYLAQGEILRSQKRYKEGVEMYSRALQQKRDDTNLLYARGLMAEKVDRLDITEADLRKVISKEPDNASALNALGYTLADRTARYQEALDYIKRAAELVPDDPAILDSLGWVSYRLGKIDEALKWLSKAFEKLEDAEIAAHYGEVLWQANQKDRARQVWAKGKANNADNPVLVETLKRIKPD